MNQKQRYQSYSLVYRPLGSFFDCTIASFFQIDVAFSKLIQLKRKHPNIELTIVSRVYYR